MVMRNEDRPNRDDSALQANAGPSTPIKYYPDVNQGKGGYMPHMGGARPANVRLKKKFDIPLNLSLIHI